MVYVPGEQGLSYGWNANVLAENVPDISVVKTYVDRVNIFMPFVSRKRKYVPLGCIWMAVAGYPVLNVEATEVWPIVFL